MPRSGRLRMGAAAALVAVVALGVLGVAYAVWSGLMPKGFEKLLDMLERGLVFAEGRARATGMLEQVEDRLEQVGGLLAEAREGLRQGKVWEAWGKAVKAMKILKSVYEEIPESSKPIRERVLAALLRRMEAAATRLENLGIWVKDEGARELIERTLEKLKPLLDDAREALEAGDLHTVEEKLEESRSVLREFLLDAREYAQEKREVRLSNFIEQFRKRLKEIEEALKAGEESEALEDIRSALNLLDEAEALLEDGDFQGARKKVVEAVKLYMGLEVTP